ncbi:hypothetical protein BG004_002163 [Podila humilis]|nr:hypothetical protein BG004_002163 [Podila humilis]
MSDLKDILDRLVQENLHGPINRQTQDREGTQRTTDRPSDNRQNHRDKDRDEFDEPDEDLDARDPRQVKVTTWRQLFLEFFLSDRSDDRNDDLLFFVQRPEVENGGFGTDPVFVKRKVKGTKGILTAEQETVVLWKDTFFLNVIVQLQCKLTVAICSRVAETNPRTGITKTSMTCTRKYVSKKVYALPTKSRMDVKEESVECSWPLIYYVIDDYEDSFEQLMVRDNEFLCVELAVTVPGISDSRTGRSDIDGGGSDKQHWSPAPKSEGPQPGKPFPSSSKTGKVTLFQGAAGFKNLLQIYQQKSSSKVGKRFKLGPHTVPTEFVMMRGPGGRGHAQVAITASNLRKDTFDEGWEGYQGSATSSPTVSYQQHPPSSAPQQSRFKTPASPSSPTSPNSGASFSVREKKTLPPIPSLSSSFTNGGVHVPGYHNNYKEQASPQSVSSSPPKSFSTSSFFQSLRRISMATLAQAAGHHAPGNGAGPNVAPTLVQSQNSQANRSNQSISSQGGGSDSQQPPPPSSPSESMADGTGSRQEIEDLVRRPQGLRCCMTFVNVPWTSIATMLMDQAYTIHSRSKP